MDQSCQYKTSLVLVGSLACIVVFFLIPFRYLGLACVACLFSAPLTRRGSQSAASPLPAEDSKKNPLRGTASEPTSNFPVHSTLRLQLRYLRSCSIWRSVLV